MRNKRKWATELRPGGVWRFVMHAPNGMAFQNFVRYVEVVEPERLVYLHGEDEEHMHFEVTVTFVERDGATEVTLRQERRCCGHASKPTDPGSRTGL